MTGMVSGLYDYYCQTLDQQKKYEEELKTAGEWLERLDKVAKKRGAQNVYGPYCSCHLAFASALTGLKRFGEANISLHEAQKYDQLNPTTMSAHAVFMQKSSLALAQGHAAMALAYNDSVRNLNETETGRSAGRSTDDAGTHERGRTDIQAAVR